MESSKGNVSPTCRGSGAVPQLTVDYIFYQKCINVELPMSCALSPVWNHLEPVFPLSATAVNFDVWLVLWSIFKLY